MNAKQKIKKVRHDADAVISPADLSVRPGRYRLQSSVKAGVLGGKNESHTQPPTN
jgi:hypothetical protein